MTSDPDRFTFLVAIFIETLDASTTPYPRSTPCEKRLYLEQ